MKERMARQDRPDVQIFMALLQSNLWRPSDSGRKIVLDWLHYVARTSLANVRSHGVLERREAFKAALAAEDTTVPKHPSQVILFPRLLVRTSHASFVPSRTKRHQTSLRLSNCNTVLDTPNLK